GLWLVVGCALGARHEAQVAHVVDPNTGELRHAEHLVGHHTTTQSDVHGTPAPGDHDGCSILAAIHQAAQPGAQRAATAAPLHAIVVAAQIATATPPAARV